MPTCKPNSLRLYLIRHGQTEWSVSGQYTGRTDIPLTAHGESAAREVGKRLQNIPFAHVLTSPLKRARQTCALAALKPALEIEPDLTEWSNGDFEGRTPAEIRELQPKWNLFRDGAPNGETPTQISDRVDRLIAHLRTLNGNVALFSHGHLCRVLAARWIGLSVEQAERLLLSTASISILSYEHDCSDEPAIALWNEVSQKLRDPSGPEQRSVERWENEGGEIPGIQQALNAPRPRRLYPLRFEPIYQYRLWGGRRLAEWLSAPLPDDEPIGEAWLLSDREDHPSLVAEGPFKGHTLAQLIKHSPEQLLGKFAGRFRRFPLLLKFLDARDTLSVHPSDQKTEYLPKDETGKTEAWVVLETGSKSCIYAGLTADSTKHRLEEAIRSGTVADRLASFTPKPGDAILIPAGTVHSLGDVVVFEVQENSDVTFRLFDWNHVDAKTGEPRALQVAQALACINFDQKAIGPVVPFVESESPALRERLIACEHFGLWRVSGILPFTVGKAETPRVLVCLSGDGDLEHDGAKYACEKGDVFLLPAAVGACLCHPSSTMTMLELSLPEVA